MGDGSTYKHNSRGLAIGPIFLGWTIEFQLPISKGDVGRAEHALTIKPV